MKEFFEFRVLILNSYNLLRKSGLHTTNPVEALLLKEIETSLVTMT